MTVPDTPYPFVFFEYDGPKNIVAALEFVVATEAKGFTYVEGLAPARVEREVPLLLLFRRRPA
jgi:hypothetical protein